LEKFAQHWGWLRSAGLELSIRPWMLSLSYPSTVPLGFDANAFTTEQFARDNRGIQGRDSLASSVERSPDLERFLQD
jgi:hypothetical protein